MSDALGPKPTVEVEVLEDRSATARCDEGFLTLRRLTLRHAWSDGEKSPAYAYDLVERAALDAVVILLVDAEGRVALRSSIRPPLAFRASASVPLPEPASDPVLWEVPAGLVEPDERGEAGLRRCAAREALEEVGVVVAEDAFETLGPPVCLSPGVMAEKLHFVVADVDFERRSAPTEDGSPLEAKAQLRFVSLEEALAATRDGRVADAKTEVALRRLAERAR